MNSKQASKPCKKIWQQLNSKLVSSISHPQIPTTEVLWTVQTEVEAILTLKPLDYVWTDVADTVQIQ